MTTENEASSAEDQVTASKIIYTHVAVYTHMYIHVHTHISIGETTHAPLTPFYFYHGTLWTIKWVTLIFYHL